MQIICTFLALCFLLTMMYNRIKVARESSSLFLTDDITSYVSGIEFTSYLGYSLQSDTSAVLSAQLSPRNVYLEDENEHCWKDRRREKAMEGDDDEGNGEYDSELIPTHTAHFLPQTTLQYLGSDRVVQGVRWMHTFIDARSHLISKRKHGYTEFPKDKTANIDELRFFCEEITDDKWYSLITDRPIGGTMKVRPFKRITFQQMTILTFVIEIGKRLDLLPYLPQILHMWRDVFKLGIAHFTPYECKTLVKLLNAFHTINIVPRQAGKSSFLKAIIAILFYMTPQLGMKMVFIDIRLPLGQEFYEAIIRNKDKFIEAFNEKSQRAYMMKHQHKEQYPPREQDVFYKASLIIKAGEKRVTIRYDRYYMHRERTANNEFTDKINSYGCSDKTNDFQMIVYRENSYRGDSSSMFFVDECEYYSQDFPKEFIPATVKDDAKTFMVSSAKAPFNKKQTMDSVRKRRPGKLCNCISFCCAAHIVSMCVNTSSMNTCPCNAMSEMVNTQSNIQKKEVCNSYTVGKDSGEDGDAAIEKNENKSLEGYKSRWALMYETGLISPTIDYEKLCEEIMRQHGINGDTSNILQGGLMNCVETHNRFKLNRFNMMELRKSPDIQVSSTLYCYIDPAGQERSYSRNGIAIAAIVHDSRLEHREQLSLKNRPSNDMAGFKSILLMADEINLGFFTDYASELTDFERETWDAKEQQFLPYLMIASIVIRAIKIIVEMLPDLFSEVIFIPETNGGPMDAWWQCMSRLRFDDPVFAESLDGINFKCTVKPAKNSGNRIQFGTSRIGETYGRTGKKRRPADVDFDYNAREVLFKKRRRMIEDMKRSYMNIRRAIQYEKGIGMDPLSVIFEERQRNEMREIDDVLDEEEEIDELEDERCGRDYIGYTLLNEKQTAVYTVLTMYVEGKLQLDVTSFSMSYTIMANQYHQDTFNQLPVGRGAMYGETQEEDLDTLMPGKRDNFAEWLVNKLKHFRVNGNNKFSGKTNTGNGQLISDDATICIIMSTWLALEFERAQLENRGRCFNKLTLLTRHKNV